MPILRKKLKDIEKDKVQNAKSPTLLIFDDYIILYLFNTLMELDISKNNPAPGNLLESEVGEGKKHKSNALYNLLQVTKRFYTVIKPYLMELKIKRSLYDAYLPKNTETIKNLSYNWGPRNHTFSYIADEKILSILRIVNHQPKLLSQRDLIQEDKTVFQIIIESIRTGKDSIYISNDVIRLLINILEAMRLEAAW